MLAAGACSRRWCWSAPVSRSRERAGERAAAGDGRGRGALGAIRRLLSDSGFWLFVVSAAALQASHQLYYGFGTLYWRGLGFSDRVIGMLWAEGVVAEIVLFWYSAPLVARFGPLGLMALGGVGGIVRWSLMGVMPGLGAAAALQLLHALTFGASHLGAMHILARRVPPGAAASAQSLYSALSAGFGSGLVMLAAGALYAAYGGQAYPFMALLSAAGLLGPAAAAESAQSGERTEGSGMLKTYEGGCHCGRVRFRIEVDSTKPRSASATARSAPRRASCTCRCTATG